MGFSFFYKSLCCTCTCAVGPEVGYDSSRFGERSFSQHGFMRSMPTGTSVGTRSNLGPPPEGEAEMTAVGSEKLAPPPYARKTQSSTNANVWPQGTGETEKSVIPYRVDTPIQSPVDLDEHKLAFGRYAYEATEEGEVSFACGERLEVIDDSQEWWMVRKLDGTEGAAPSNWLSVVPDFLVRTKLTARVVSSYTPTDSSTSAGSSASGSSSDGIVRVAVTQGEVVDILDDLDRMEWNVRRANGTSGCVPMEHLKLCPEDISRAKTELQVKTLWTYPSSDAKVPLSPSELSFMQGEIIDIVYRAPSWWLGRNSAGDVGIVPSNYLTVL